MTAFGVDLLGAVQARRGGVEVSPAGAKQQALLASLAMAEGAVVPAGELIGMVWEEPPGNPEHALRGQISRLRGQLGVAIDWRHGGYRMTPPTTMDTRRFAELAARGRRQLASGRCAAAAATLTEALSLWRGEPLAGVPDTPGLRPERARLEGLRVAAAGDRLEALLCLGETDRVAEEARAITGAYPLHERFWAQLMTALHRQGHRTEALAAFVDLRGYLREELGAGPSVPLGDLHLQILRAEGPDAAGPRLAALDADMTRACTCLV